MFLIGGAWARLEYKMDEGNKAVQVMIEKYVISNDYDKKILSMEISNLKTQVDVNSLTIKAITEFIKPEKPEIKAER